MVGLGSISEVDRQSRRVFVAWVRRVEACGLGREVWA